MNRLMLKLQYSSAFKAQLFYVLLCVIWNGVAMWQIQIGEQPIGPTASWFVILFLILFVTLLAFLLHRNLEIIYLCLSFILFSLAAMAISGGFTKDHELWPSEFWRITGIVINVIGVIAFILVVQVFFKLRSK